ncbi:MAG: hypothetical protein EHM50_06340 [Lysobacterales bacterium]|nr:MAG: hypothetical protein EHM50_06340 [Xanthomonadales bacterium]
MKLRSAGFAVATFFASSASAQGLDWRVTPYLWGAGIQGDIALGPVARDVDVEFSDVLNVLSGGVLMHVEAQSDDHVVFGDLVWLALEPEEEIATIGGVAEAELDTTIIELGYARDSDAFGLELGLRYWDLDIEIDPALAAGIVRGDSWIDVFGGIRNTRELGQSWTLTTRANAGAGGADLSIGFQMDFARELSGGNAIVAGFKLLDVDYEEDSVRGIPFALDTTFFGATVGFRFD